ncbi:hypothetical protein K458DRAFT_382273 [Lentithecium fluviatile CBS 122367]|uniref:Rhodopsin domain-containing protein n=1 Tax=Lentithecium fluviatile CBS 122367 TaxID=1168545 RepID=A0A6G1JJN2_9PLEO|nr:hypothetical protein K458DRAFT_382273 [Lentithecium fluviatile CBS 122367]
MLLDLRNSIVTTETTPYSTWTQEPSAGDVAQLLVNVCIAFAILETFFIFSFILSWHFNKDNNTNNTKGVYALILAGYVFCFGGVVIGVLKITMGGAGYHVDILPPKTIRRMLQLVKAHEVIYVMSIPFPKLAILCLYLRLFTSRISRAILYATAFIIIATALFGLIATFTNCRPLNAFWNPAIKATCTMDVMMAFRFYSVPNIATDVVMVLLPTPALYRLNVSTLAKVGVALTFAICTLGIVTAAMRFVAFLHVNVFQDITYLCVSTSSWSIIEPGVYLMAATVPTLQPLLRRLFQRTAQRTISCHNTPQIPNSSFKNGAPGTPIIERPRLSKKQSEKEMVATIGRAPSRNVVLDDYHNIQYGAGRAPSRNVGIRYGSGIYSVRSEDDESMVCADAIVHEMMGQQGRNPDGTLQVWSLQPIVVSPLATSFYFDDNV